MKTVKHKTNNSRQEVTVELNEGLKKAESRINEIINKKNQEMPIKFKRRDIPLLLGSIGLGLWMQKFCHDYDNPTDTYSINAHSTWMLEVENIFTEIKNQTGISEEKILVSEDLMEEIETIYKPYR